MPSGAIATGWGSAPVQPAAAPAAPARMAISIRPLFDEHFDFIWRSIRRLGLTEAEADDAAQSVFIVASRKLEAIVPGKERAFLFGVAVRVVADVRKGSARRLEVELGEHHAVAVAVSADVEVDAARARACLEEAVATMPMDLRTVFVLYELEELTMAQIAEIVGLPPGTVASRLRRSREHFDVVMAKLRKRFGGGT